MDGIVQTLERETGSQLPGCAAAGIENIIDVSQADTRQRRPARPGARRALAVLLALVGCALAVGVAREFRPAAARVVPTNLGLAARVEGTQIVLSWNQRAASIRSAGMAVLSIQDGAQREDVPLDVTILRTRRVAYSPLSRDVTFLLTVDNPENENPVVESVRILIRSAETAAAPGVVKN
jgi:hypothetical protein